MARPSKKVKELQAQIKALPPDEQAEVVRGVMTPTMRFCMLVKEGWKKQAKEDPRVIAREVRAAQREVARERQARGRSKRELKRAS